jgi:hypothetical protein
MVAMLRSVEMVQEIEPHADIDSSSKKPCSLKVIAMRVKTIHIGLGTPQAACS